MGKAKNSLTPDCSTIIDIGTYDELVSKGHDIPTIVDDDNYSLSDDIEEIPSTKIVSAVNSTDVGIHADPDIAINIDHNSVVEDLKPTSTIQESMKDNSKKFSHPSPVKLSSVDDNMAVGAVPVSTYLTYFKSSNLNT